MRRKYTLQGFEHLAQNTIKHYNGELVSGEPTAIPIAEMIELHLGLSIQSTNLSTDDSIHGVTVFEDCRIPVYNAKTRCYEYIFVDSGTILIDSKLFAENRINRLRFTLAHELAHWLVHQENFKNKEGLAYKTSNNTNSAIEREADQLAAALLMPYGRVKVAYARFSGRLTYEAVVQQLATIFCVSTQAMSIRLERLDFVKVENTKKAIQVNEIKCPFCGNHLLEIATGSQPFQSNVLGMELRLPCHRCGESVRLSLVNAN